MSDELMEAAGQAAEQVLDVLLQGYSLDASVTAICFVAAEITKIAADYEEVSPQKMGEDICSMIMRRVNTEQGDSNE